MKNGYYTLPDLAKSLGLSIPTITKLVEEFVGMGIIEERGKLETNGGRHPVLYGLNPDSCYLPE